jgi:hypothetical protein
MGLMIALFGAAGSVAFGRTGSLRLAGLAAVWCATVGFVITCSAAFAIDLGFMPRLVRNLSEAFARSGMADPRAFVVRNTLESASTHLIVAPILAAIAGLIGGMAAAGLQEARREVAVALAALVVVLLASSVALLRHAQTLERPRRPPFVMSGMLLGGLTLACVYPVFAAAGRAPSRSGMSGPPWPISTA